MSGPSPPPEPRNPGKAALQVRPLLAAALTLWGCGTSPPTHFFTLDPVAPHAARASPPYVGAPVRVRAVHLPPNLDRPELSSETSPGSVRVDDFARWASPLGPTVRRVLAEDLAARVSPGSFVTPEAPLPPGGCDLEVDILSFNAAGGEAVMQASWSLLGRSGAADQAVPPMLLTLRTSSLERGSPGVAEGLSRLLGDLASNISAGLQSAAPDAFHCQK